MKKILTLFVMLLCFTLFLNGESYAARYQELSVGTLELQGNSSGTTQTLMKDGLGKILLQTGTTLPTDGTSGYAKGGIFIDTGAVNAARSRYENEGTSTSSAFRPIGGASNTMSATYDFAVDGGTHNTGYGLGISLPDNAIVTRTWYEVFANLSSATGAAIISLDIPTDDAAGLVAFASISAAANVWDTGNHEGIQTGTVTTFAEKTTDEREVTFSIASSEDVTAGKATFFIEYVVTE